MELPTFKYHPDPVSTGSIEQSANICIVCGQARGWIYTGPVYASGEYVNCICPWCIADNSAHAKLDAEFTDLAGIGEFDPRVSVAKAITEAVAFRTPGFIGWQQERWFTHCGDAAAFIGRMGYEQLKALGPAAIKVIRDDSGLHGAKWKEFFVSLDQDDSPTAYLFRCLHCGAYGGYQDSD